MDVALSLRTQNYEPPTTNSLMERSTEKQQKRRKERERRKSENDLERRKMALVESITENGDRLMGLIASIVQNRQDAEEVYQDLWIRVFQEWETDKFGETNLLIWQARFMAYDRYRQVARRQVNVIFGDILNTLGKAVPQDAYTREEEIAMKEKLWSEFPGIALDDEIKEILWLHARYEVTYEEIGKMFGHARSTIGDKVKKARRILKEFIIEEENQIQAKS